MLDNFEIENFRSFSQLRVDRLGRVNLVVGRNNVGKTMFLEALRLHASGGNPLVLRNLLLERDEVITDVTQIDSDDSDFHLRVASLFHRRLIGSGSLPTRMRLGPTNDPDQALQIEVKMLRRIRSAQSPIRSYEIVDDDAEEEEQNIALGLRVVSGKVTKIYPFQSFDANRYRVHRSEGGLMRPAFVPARGVSDREIARWWDAVALQDAENRVIECLRIIAPVERINLVEHPVRRGERLVMVKMAGDSAPVPLKSLGDGMSRMFQIALALECSKVGVTSKFEGEGQMMFFDPLQEDGTETALLLVDEVENGIHYTVLPDLWRFLLRVAKNHDVQVFATSHSWDCILGLQQATVDTPDAQAMLIRLEQQRQVTKAVLFDPKELAIVTRDEIEVR